MHITTTAESRTDESDPVGQSRGNLGRFCRSVKMVCAICAVVRYVRSVNPCDNMITYESLNELSFSDGPIPTRHEPKAHWWLVCHIQVTACWYNGHRKRATQQCLVGQAYNIPTKSPPLDRLVSNRSVDVGPSRGVHAIKVTVGCRRGHPKGAPIPLAGAVPYLTQNQT